MTMLIDFFVHRILGLDVNNSDQGLLADLEKRAEDELDPALVYLEPEPSVAEWLKGVLPTIKGVGDYVVALFPSASWIGRYNMRWLAGDMLAGITIGLVIVPQALAYASLADLPPAYGLYTSFTGAALYWIVGTSKDIVIGATSVGSLLVGGVVSRVVDSSGGQYGNDQIAYALSLLCGAILLFLGLVRLGWVIEFIPYIPISAFVTAASITIMSTQFPTALGISGVNAQNPPYKVILAILAKLPEVKLDAAIGLSSIVLLFTIKAFCARMEERQPARSKLWTYMSSLRLTFVMLLFTLISYLINRNESESRAKFRLVGHIERGFQQAGIPAVDTHLVSLVLPQVPAVAVILVIEHIAIAKAMARRFEYTIKPSQEMIALGTANLLSPFVGGYVCTGSFGASAVLSKAGVKTPLAGFFGAGVLVLAMYALTSVFFYIPKAALSGLIIHAVWNLLATPKTLHRYWRISPVELLIWVVGIVMAIFVSLEACIYTGTGLSLILVLTRLARTKGTFLGSARVYQVTSAVKEPSANPANLEKLPVHVQSYIDGFRDVFLPLGGSGATNPDIQIDCPYPGIFIYRLHQGLNYFNQAYHFDMLGKYVMDRTRRVSDKYEKNSDRLWSDPGPTRSVGIRPQLPHLRALILDFGAVAHIDITSVQGLVDVRNVLDRHAAPDTVEWHFANVHNGWTRRALTVVGFGYPTPPLAAGIWRPIYSIAATLTGKDRPLCNQRPCVFAETDTDEDGEHSHHIRGPGASQDVPRKSSLVSTVLKDSTRQVAALSAVNRPFFHPDLRRAVEAATRNARNC